MRATKRLSSGAVKLISNCIFSFLIALAFIPSVSEALTPLDDGSMADVSGEGIAFAFQDYRMAMAGTSYLQLTGTTPATVTVGGASYTPELANVRYYGLSLSDGRPDASGGPDSSNGAAMSAGFGMFNFDGSACTSTTGAGCPVGGVIPMFAAYDNPFVLRVFNYSNNTGAGPSGSTATLDYNGTSVNNPVLELLAPTQMDSVRLSSMIEMAGDTAGKSLGTCVTDLGATDTHCWLKAQFMIYDDTSTDQSGIATIPSGNAGSFIRFVRSDGEGYSTGDVSTTTGNGCASGSTSTTVGNPNCDPTFGIIGLWHLTGDFRFNVNMSNATGYGTGSDGLDSTTVPIFSQREGLFMFGMNTYLPLGQMFYQTITFNEDSGQTGNFVIELGRLPNVASVYADFYGITSTSTDQGYPGSTGYSVSASYARTHGYVYLGVNLWAPSSYTLDANRNAVASGCTNIQGTCTFSSPPTCTSSTSCTTNDGMVFFSSSTTSTFTAASNRPDPSQTDWVNSINNNQTTPAPINNPNNGSFNVVNLGDSNISGILLQHLSIKSCSAGPTGGAC